MTGYDYSRQWWDFAFENPGLTSGNHGSMYFWHIELNNRLGWVSEFTAPAAHAMMACGIKSWHTYKKVFDDLVKWGFFEVVMESKNQYTATIIRLRENVDKKYSALDKSISNNALIKNDEANVKANDEALTDHLTDHLQSIYKGKDSINKHINLETNKPINHKHSLSVENEFSTGENENDLNGSKKNKEELFENFEVITSEEEKKENPPSKVPRKVSPGNSKKKNPEDYSIVHKLRLNVEKKNSLYEWSAAHAKAAKELSIKLANGFKKTHNTDPTDEDILNSFDLLILKLPAFWANKWSMMNLNSSYNEIILQIKNPNSNGKQVNQHGNPIDQESLLRGASEFIAERSAQRAADRLREQQGRN